MNEPMKYDNLDYTPAYGSVEIHGHEHEWAMDVSIEQGRSMEADGVEVLWIQSSAPMWVLNSGQPFVSIWMGCHRVITWPSRLFK